MEVVLGIIFLGVLFILMGGIENHDNNSEDGKAMIAELQGPTKVAMQNSGGCMMWGGLLIIVLTVAAVIASGGF